MQPSFNPHLIKLAIGLGNPGKLYANTYHNIGFLTVDYLNSGASQEHRSCDVQKLIKSEVYMNESGKFVKTALRKHGVRPRELLIIHDDSDLVLGKYKLSFGRGSAGHKGVESVIKKLKTKDFWRLRIGVRKLGIKRQELGIRKRSGLPAEARRAKAGEFVLKNISKQDRDVIASVFSALAQMFYG